VYVERLLDVGASKSHVHSWTANRECVREISFFKTVKWEEVYLHQYQTFEEAQASLQTFLEDVYNAKRLHSSLEYVPPDEFELKYAMCSCLSGLDFLGALQVHCCQMCCHCYGGEPGPEAE
jgi:integrase-like protein